jgi:hypothetical protein
MAREIEEEGWPYPEEDQIPYDIKADRFVDTSTDIVLSNIVHNHPEETFGFKIHRRMPPWEYGVIVHNWVKEVGITRTTEILRRDDDLL